MNFHPLNKLNALKRCFYFSVSTYFMKYILKGQFMWLFMSVCFYLASILVLNCRKGKVRLILFVTEIVNVRISHLK